LLLNPCRHICHVTSSLTRGWVCLAWIAFAFFKCTYSIYSTSLHDYGEWLYFPESVRSEKSNNLERISSHGVRVVCLRAEAHLYVSFAAVYWAHRDCSNSHAWNIWHGPHRKHLSSVAVSKYCLANMLVCEAVTQ
jgi:hypothetical protein